jgi:hypothetical protein
MSVNSSLVKKYKNLLIFLLVPTVVAVTMSIVGNNIFFNDDDELFGNVANTQNTNRAFAQQIQTAKPVLPTDKITLAIVSTQFMPLTNSTFNQLKIVVRYKTNDASLINTTINGVMRVFSLNGSIIKTSSFPNGFILNKTGTIQFATSFTGNTIQTVRTDIVLKDLNKINPLSNIVSAYVPYNIVK